VNPLAFHGQYYKTLQFYILTAGQFVARTYILPRMKHSQP
jgi:hypothetical protein